MLLDELAKKGLIDAPDFVISNTAYLTIVGSHAYGVADTAVKDKIPDRDCYGFCIPKLDILFPHLRGEIPGFGTKTRMFEQYQQHGIFDTNAHAGRGQEWDLQIFNIVKYFELCRQGNPNLIDSLFTPEECVIHCTKIGRMVRDNRKLFISKEIWTKFRGYAYAQLKKMEYKNPEGSRLEIVNKFGYDVKFAYHILRLLDEVQQLLETGEMNLQRAKEAMKAIRRGEWSIQDVKTWAMCKERELEIAFTNCNLPPKADEGQLRTLLLACMEEHYGSLEKAVVNPNWAEQGMRDIANVISRYQGQL